LSDVAGYFSSRLPPDPRRTVLWRALWDAYFRFLIREEDTVLDIGAGYCDFINAVHARIRIAVDQWPGFCAHALSGVEAHVGSLTDLGWLADGSVDFAFASNVFEHITQPELSKLLAQLRTKLSPTGRLCLIQPNYRYCYKEYYDDYTHVTVFSHVSLQDFLVANEFRVLDCKPRFLPLTLKSRVPVHSLLIRAYLASPIKPLGKQMLVLAEPLTAVPSCAGPV
jgi:SAM-dependent methyltransferase